ncbi:hypothetical protein [Leptospira biflexa]|uniref:hypothetical protein n=1 Tax=Leptospira biflexa TaxID=172 RepID=UPI001083574F|nr:hypothetical protein [Leptospira biflexa]TGM31586.1 hypothetical protein EHQ89_16420 [Leptospira biflexa]TGM39254.1 hypothetical protein EHQ80_04690 [Leptospira biflexa]
MKEFVIDEYKSGLGHIVLSLESDMDFKFNWKKSDKKLISSDDFSLLICETKIQNSWLPKDMKVDSSHIWICLITKESNQPNPLKLKIKLVKFNSDTTWDYASGEDLDAIEIQNAKYIGHIGTEDAEAFRKRAEENNDLPLRFGDKLGFSASRDYSFTEYIDFGFITNIPELKKGEFIYFHYISAINEKKFSEDGIEMAGISTWYAVDQNKQKFEVYLSTNA